MKTIEFKKVAINNFKKIINYEFNFTEKCTTFKGHYGCGKSTIRKSLDYVLGIKVDDYRPHEFRDNEWLEIEGVGDTDVTWVIKATDENGIESEYKLQVVSDKNGCKYYVDDIKYATKTEYQNHLVTIFGVEDFDTLELATHLDKFNQLDWNKQRELLKKLTNVDAVLEETKKQDKYAPLYTEYFSKGFGEVEIKKALAKKKKDLENEKAETLGAIREQENIVKQYESVDYLKIQEEINKVDKQVAELSVDNQRTTIGELNNKLQAIENDIQKASIGFNEIKSNNERIISEANKKISDANIELERANINVENGRKEIEELEQLKKDYKYESTYTCPTCGSVVNNPKSEEDSFKEFCEKCDTELANAYTIVNDGLAKEKELKEQITKYESDITTARATIDGAKAKYDGQVADLNELKEVTQMDTDYYNGIDNTSKISELNKQKIDLIERLATKALLSTATSRIGTLTEKKTETLKAIQDNITLEELRQEFSNGTISVIENHINSFFTKDLHWKLFSKLKTTGEVKEDLRLIAFGKDYETACSNGEKILANVCLIVGLQNILKVNLPIFVDDYNSIGVTLKPQQQIVMFETTESGEIEGMQKF